MVLDSELLENLDLAKKSLSGMSISDRLQTWDEIHGGKLDVSGLNFDPSSIPPKSFDPEDINSVFGVPISYNKGSNKIEPLTIEKNSEAFRIAQTKSVQDIKDLGSKIYEGVKLIDITGVLHWQDYSKAQEDFEKNPNTQTSLNLLICSLAVIPAIGAATSPSKALKTGLNPALNKSLKDLPKDISRLSQAERDLEISPILKEANKLFKSSDELPEGINKNVLNNALLILDKKRNKVNPTIPANVFKDMITDFKTNGGKFVKKQDYGNYHAHSDNIVLVDPKAGSYRTHFRSIIAHEMGHSFTVPKNPRSTDLPPFEPAFALTKNKTKNPYDWRYNKNFKEELDKTIFKELNADLEVLRRMKLGGASEKQMSDYASQAIKAVQSYKHGFFISEPSLYADAIAVKKVLLDNKETAQVATKVLYKKPELMSDFPKLINTLSLEFSKQGDFKMATQLKEKHLGSWEGKLYVEKTIAGNRHYKAKRFLDSKDSDNISRLKYMEKNLEDFGYYKKLISDNIGSLRLRELEKFVIPKEIKKIDSLSPSL